MSSALAKISYESGHAKPHTLYHQRSTVVVGMENVAQPVQDQTITEINGRYGTITIKTNREIKSTDEDIHTLIARILLKKAELEQNAEKTVG